uniref:Uncharacterized protein n=1 Tax=Trachysalambria curvirostris majanivirus TaxID=2984281 RepID=A0A9C7BQZ7_9VIRU|nr:MAG: hypothetical protein [Trachysalambria curvirostris majanivirus]
MDNNSSRNDHTPPPSLKQSFDLPLLSTSNTAPKDSPSSSLPPTPRINVTPKNNDDKFRYSSMPIIRFNSVTESISANNNVPTGNIGIVDNDGQNSGNSNDTSIFNDTYDDMTNGYINNYNNKKIKEDLTDLNKKDKPKKKKRKRIFFRNNKKNKANVETIINEDTDSIDRRKSYHRCFESMLSLFREIFMLIIHRSTGKEM